MPPPPDTIFNLPAYKIGPYEMRVQPAPRAAFGDKRRILENDWTAGIVRIVDTASPMRALELFLRHLITAIHYRSGLNDTCDEEAYTHSLSTGLVELARSNPYFWEAFIGVLERTLRPNSGWLEAAGGVLPDAAFDRPKQISHEERGCNIVRVPHRHCEQKSAYGFYTPGEGPVEFSDGLRGLNLALVVLHEVVHFLHDVEGMTDKHSEAVFKKTQARMLLRFWKANPKFWRWWLSTVNPHNSVSVHQALAA